MGQGPGAVNSEVPARGRWMEVVVERRLGGIAVGGALLLALCAGAGCRSAPVEAQNVAPSEVALTASGSPRWSVERAFPALSFERPVDLQNAGDGKLFVVEQAGVIKVFDADKAGEGAEVFLDLRERVVDGGELGLLGLAFHPRYAQNGLFFVNYTAPGPTRTIISRFKARGGKAEAGDEEVLLEFLQPYSNHNGGQVAFGPDGFLYVAVGDGGAGGDPEGHGQDLSTLLGSILRLDVDRADPGMKVAIPADNPFVKTSGARKEIWAYGLRNPWRMSFDAETGELWTGDVGQNALEEVDVIVRGGNYGWKVMEGFSCYDAARCDSKGLILPVIQYPHTLGTSITGGHVYRGKRHKALQGQYIYGDFTTGRLWSVRRVEGQKPEGALLAETGMNISSFGVDRHGELYLLDYSSGTLHTLKSTQGAP